MAIEKLEEDEIESLYATLNKRVRDIRDINIASKY
jgi:hypothetical protein